MNRKWLKVAMVTSVIFGLFSGLTAMAADPPKVATSANPTVKGKLDIQFETRTKCDDNGKPEFGAMDKYVVDITAADTVSFQGKITRLPTIFSSVLGREQQQGALSYDLGLLIRNPANLAQTRTVGKMVGTVPVDKKGVYQYEKGNLRVAVNAIGKSPSFESAYRGSAAGKPPKNESSLAKAKKQALTITKQVKGKTVKIAVTDYDVMQYSDLILAAGPAQSYPEAKVNGDVIYDYERGVWFFKGATITTQVDGKPVTDKLSGNIRWVESPQRKDNGEGQYEFDVRVNEPEQANTEAAAFQPAGDEASFFETDSNLSSLTGTMKYKDQMRGESVTASVVNIDLVGNKLNKHQIVALTKLLFLVNVAPMNDE